MITPNGSRPRKWSQIPYAGKEQVPFPEESSGGTWSTFTLNSDEKGVFLDPFGQKITWDVRHPDTIDFKNDQLEQVKNTLKNLSKKQITIAEYWNAGPPTKQFNPIIDRLIDTYKMSALRATRILAAVHAGIHDTLIVTWYLKYLWEVPRPIQLDQKLATICCTPKHPSYPAGHSTVAGCFEVILRYFFPTESKQLHKLAEECSISRLYAGVHYPIDLTEGLKLGRQIGQMVVDKLNQDHDGNQVKLDYTITENLHANLMPPPYKQMIPFPRERNCDSLLDPREDPDAR